MMSVRASRGVCVAAVIAVVLLLQLAGFTRAAAAATMRSSSMRSPVVDSNQDYTWPTNMKQANHTGPCPPSNLGLLITEGCVPYPGGPPCWNPKTAPSGFYGWTDCTPSSADGTDAGCPPIPEATLPGLNRTLVSPQCLNEHGNKGMHQCFISCNITDVQRTGVDPCAAGSVPGLAKMRCFYGGAGNYGSRDGGMCSYGCVLRTSTGAPCTASNPALGGCGLYCDPRNIPHAGEPTLLADPSARVVMTRAVQEDGVTPAERLPVFRLA